MDTFPARTRHRAATSTVHYSARSILVLATVSLIGLAMYAWPLLASAESQIAHSADAPVIFAVILGMLVFVVLSEVSVKSDWVEYEIKKAREKEKRENRDVMCPVALGENPTLGATVKITGGQTPLNAMRLCWTKDGRAVLLAGADTACLLQAKADDFFRASAPAAPR